MSMPNMGNPVVTPVMMLPSSAPLVVAPAPDDGLNDSLWRSVHYWREASKHLKLGSRRKFEQKKGKDDDNNKVEDIDAEKTTTLSRTRKKESQSLSLDNSPRPRGISSFFAAIYAQLLLSNVHLISSIGCNYVPLTTNLPLLVIFRTPL